MESYENALRVIGRQLDTEPAYHLSIMEVEDGFTVRHWAALHQSEARTTHYTWERLRDLSVFQSAGRGCVRKHGRHQGLWATIPGGHQAYFRALGHQLDEENASSLTLDEVPEGVAVSYLRPDSDNPLRSHKYHVIMSENDVRALVAEAEMRRGKRLEAVRP
jgi:hypothetical protein